MIPNSEYKNLIWKNIRNIENFKDHPKSGVTLEGLNKLSGKLIYTIKFDQPIKKITADPSTMVSIDSSNGATVEKVYWIGTGENAEGIKIEFNLNWGKVLKQNSTSCYLDIFEESLSSLPDLGIDIFIRGFELANQLKLNSTIRITSEVESYSMESKLYLKYTKYSKDEYGNVSYPLSSASIDVNETITNGLPKNSTLIRIGEKRIHATNSNSSQNKPTIPSKPSQDSDSDNVASILRLYNPNTGEHLFTSSAAERVQLVAIGWRNEYCEWNTPSTSDTPIYRLYNPNNGDHHYTTNGAEKDMLVQVGWNYEGTPFYSATKGEEIPVYRLYNPNTTSVGSHHYTSSKEEVDALQTYGWNYEGIAWYGISK